MAVVTGILGTWFGTWLGVVLRSRANQEAEQLALKRDVLRRFMGNRYMLTKTGVGVQPNGEPLVAMNEAFIVFARDRQVIEALKSMHTAMREKKCSRGIVGLAKEMAKASDVPIELDDWFIEHPFTPKAG
ncbi:MAG: hypothetical protein OXG04_21960 [Acidobacteria bacterium]|nr:hypothetical protein [Acidobacteriota bacterium]